MYFVFSSWYIILGLLAVLAIACIVSFILMDRKDRVIIQEFLDNAGKIETDSENEGVKESEIETDKTNE